MALSFAALVESQISMTMAIWMPVRMPGSAESYSPRETFS
jgi:hypothetical protein